MNCVAHDCRNTRNGSCNNRWIDKDVTRATTQIPTWKYCRECCEKMGIDFDSQKPNDYRSEEEIKARQERITKMLEHKRSIKR